jgi:hypothetical protein
VYTFPGIEETDSTVVSTLSGITFLEDGDNGESFQFWGDRSVFQTMLIIWCNQSMMMSPPCLNISAVMKQT